MKTDDSLQPVQADKETGKLGREIFRLLHARNAIITIGYQKKRWLFENKIKQFRSRIVNYYWINTLDLLMKIENYFTEVNYIQRQVSIEISNKTLIEFM